MSCSLLVVNARLHAPRTRRPAIDAIAVDGVLIKAVGPYATLRDLRADGTEIVDAAGGLVIPAFHDAHMHLLSLARQESRVDCSTFDSIAAIGHGLARRAAQTPAHGWVRGTGYDDRRLARDGRHPDRWDLDAAVADRPTRLQHRSQHLDVLNTRALRATGLLESSRPEVERDPRSGTPTGRLYHAAELLRGISSTVTPDELATNVRATTDHLLSMGVTTIQDASITNGEAQWELFHQLAKSGALRVRTFMCPGLEHWPAVYAAQPPTAQVRYGPVKLMLAEARFDRVADLRAVVSEVHRSGHAVAIHAVTAAEIAVAADAIAQADSASVPSTPTDRIEHGSSVPDALLPDLRAVGVMVVGQPGLVYSRGDAYRADHPVEEHAWLHRVRSFLTAGVPYAVGSDAPVGDAEPGRALVTMMQRRTAGGSILAAGERVSFGAALTAMTAAPARAVGVERELGVIAPGALADIVVLDPDALLPTARLTIKDGQVVWRT